MAEPTPILPNPQPAGRSLPPLRSDIEITRRDVASGAEYILKDPLSNQHFRLDQEEWFVATLLDGQRTLDEVHARVLQQFPELNLPATEVAAFVQRLALSGVLSLSGRQDLDRLTAGQGARRRGWKWLLGGVGRIFYLQFPLLNPDPLISRLAPHMSFLLRPWTRLAAGLIVAAALVLLGWQGARLWEPQAEFLSPQGLFYLFLAIIVIKIVHEFGHACVCKLRGGRVTEMGLVFIVFTPCLYCDVSDAWTFASRRQRLEVTAAGVAVELLLAALAAIVFLVTHEGWLHQAAFSIMIAASFSTILFNGNPLLRYDGYYLLSDWLEIPNLRIRARRYITALGRRLFFGTPVAELDRPGRLRWFTFVYAIASYLYGWFILYAILGLIYRKLAPYNLENLAGFVIVLSLIFQLGVPLYRLLARLADLARRPDQARQLVRPALIIAGAAVVILVILQTPFNENLSRTCLIEAAQPADVRAPWPGFVAEVCVKTGQVVKPGDTLLVLENRDLRLDLDRARLDREENQVLLDRARAVGNQSQVQQLQLEARQLEQLYQAARLRLQDMTVAATSPGVVLTDDLKYSKGRYVNKGDLLVRLGNPGEVKVTLDLGEREAERVSVGAAASLRVRSDAARTFQGSVTGNSRTASNTADPVLTTLYEGEVPVQRTGDGWQSAQRIYHAELQISDISQTLHPGMSGRARICLGRTNLGAYLWNAVRNELSLDLLLNWPGA